MNEILAPDSLSWTTSLLRLLAATLLPLAIGLERFLARKPIDFRPYVVISVVSCALMLGTSDYLLTFSSPAPSIDPTRVMQGVITGIGFLGAGAMYRDGDYVKGAGTAASIWSAGAIGLVCGVGEIWLAGLVTVIIVGLMLIAAPFTDRWDNSE